jgi:hypothetical protein
MNGSGDKLYKARVEFARAGKGRLEIMDELEGQTASWVSE